MSNRSVITYALFVLLFVALQALLVRNLVLFDYAFCFVYVGAILFMPREINSLLLLALAFGVGLLVDLFYDTFGMHAAATVLMAFLRPQLLRYNTPSGGYESTDEVWLGTLGIGWMLLYAVPLVLVHHLTLFLIEAAEWRLLGQVGMKILYSVPLTLLLLLMVQYAVQPARRRA